MTTHALYQTVVFPDLILAAFPLLLIIAAGLALGIIGWVALTIISWVMSWEQRRNNQRRVEQ